MFVDKVSTFHEGKKQKFKNQENKKKKKKNDGTFIFYVCRLPNRK